MSANGTALPLRMLTQDKNPAWNIYGGSGQSLPTLVTVVASTNLSDTGEDATIAQAAPSTNSPVQLTITPASMTIPAAGRGIIRVEGTDEDGTDVYEEWAWSTASNTAVRGRIWFKTITKVRSSGFSAGTYTVATRDRSAQVIFTPQDLELVAYWTAEVAKGVVPNLYYGLIMQNCTIEVTPEAFVAFDATMLGRRAKLYENLAGDTTPPSDLSTWRTPSTGLETASADVYAGWQGVLTAENTDIEIAQSEMTLTLNQELAYTNVRSGTQYQVSPPVRDAKRLTQMEATVLYDPHNDFSTYFEGNQVIPNVKLTFKQSGYGAYPYELVFEMPECQLTADPDPAITDTGQITQTLTMKAVRPRTGLEYRVVARYSEYEEVKDYS